MQLDLYHVQIVEGDLARKIHQCINEIVHFETAGGPGRQEPDIGEINHPYLFDLIEELGSDGWIGYEYQPEGETTAGLGWAKRYLD